MTTAPWAPIRSLSDTPCVIKQAMLADASMAFYFEWTPNVIGLAHHYEGEQTEQSKTLAIFRDRHETVIDHY